MFIKGKYFQMIDYNINLFKVTGPVMIDSDWSVAKDIVGYC